jgi:arylsulfatase A-like enzyme
MALLVALAGVFDAGCRSRPSALTVDGHRPDILLITVDALRADHLGAYGYDRPTSPNMDALAREGVVVREHIAQAPYTKASIASLFTGLFPTAHKAFTTSRTFVQTMSGHVSGSLPVTDVLDPKLQTLAESLAAAGYQTIGLDSNPFLLAEFGFDQGFSMYEFLSHGGDLAEASQITTRAMELIDQRDRSKPLFLWCHLMEPHSPYTPAADVRQLFPPRSPPLTVPAAVIPSWIAQNGSTDAHFYEALYDAEIREADAALGAFFDALRARGLWSNLVVVLTADHGEEFFEHGGFEHNRTLYDEMLHVPLIVKAPGLQQHVADVQTQAVDLAPTLIALAGGRVPDGLHGADIWPLLLGGSTSEPYAYAELVGKRYALRTREWKFISNLDRRSELYHLTGDAGEHEDLASRELDRAGKMGITLTRILASAANAGERIQGQYAPIPESVLKRLKSLGYIQ